MTSITQKIPNLIGGISQQPDELMPVGSVRDAVNVIPDVTDGLKKRAGSRLVNPLLTNEEGSWFHFNYADNQKYIGKINYDGTVNIFNVADGLPTNVYYKDWEYTPDEDANSPFPECDQAAVASAKSAWQAKVREYNVANGELNSILNQKGSTATTEEQIKYRVEQVTVGSPPDGRFPDGRGYQAYRVYEGQISKSGPDIYLPESVSGYQRRRGNKKLNNVTLYQEDGTLIYNADVFENIFYRPVDPTTDFDAEIKAKRAEADALRREVDNLYATYVGEVSKCGYDPTPNIQRDIVGSYTPPEYLQHTLPQQLKTLVVGDTIFVTNPRVPTSMEEESVSATRATENYIELTTIAANKVYTVKLTDEVSKGTSYTVVTEVDVIDSKYETTGQSCATDFNDEVFNDPDDPNKVNLGIRIDVRGVQEQTGDGTSLNDFVCKYTVTARITNGGSGWQEGDVVEIECANRTHKVQVKKVERIYDPSAKAYIFPPATPNGSDTVIKANEILDDLSQAIKAVDNGFQTKIIGDGLYITHSDPDYVFSFETPEGQLMNVVTNQVNNIADLPKQCKGGYIVKIANTDSEYDDYWAEFVTEFKGIDGPGVWEETIAPGYPRVINAGSMPHKITRTAKGNFIVSPIDWESRLVGDDITNPVPSFISRENDNRYINKMAFFRNRLVMLSGDNAVCSRPGDYYNFFKGSALQLVDNDPVDIAVGSTSSSANAAILDAIEVAEGLLTFTENEQHVLSTDSEVFSPTTARFSRIGTYRFNGQIAKYITQPDQTTKGIVRGAQVFSLGNSVGFLSDAGLNSKLMEIYNIGRTAEASANELSKPVSRLVPYGINAIADSKDNNIIALARRGTKNVWVYRYFDNDQQRQQSAWFRWRMLGTMVYHCIMDDVYWYVSLASTSSVGVPEDDRQIVSLQRIDLKDELATAFVSDQFAPSDIAGEIDLRDETGQPYQAHLDNYRIAQPSEFTYYPHLNQTYFRAPLAYYKEEADAGNLVAYMLSPTQFQRESADYGDDATYYFVKIGSMVPIRVEEDNLGTWFVMDGNFSETRMMIGYQVEMKVELPTLYPTQSRTTLTSSVTRTDTRSSLTLHRLKVNFGQTGVYESTIKVKGRDDYTELYECKTMDIYPANEIAFDQTKTQTVPIYANNKNTNITISSTHPSPATINSVEWEGDYSSMYYKRV